MKPTIRDTITPILTETYGRGGMTQALTDLLAKSLERCSEGSRRETMVMHVCWDWMPGGTTAATVARRIETALVERDALVEGEGR